jgi:hypothetical protein
VNVFFLRAKSNLEVRTMTDEFVLPVPELFSTEIINLGPIISPPFSDAKDWSKYLPQVETKPVDFEPLESNLTEDSARQAVELALSSKSVISKLEEKRYEIMGVGLRSIDRDTEYPLVVIYNYTDDVVLEALVDLVGTTILEITLERYQPPLVPSELTRALDMVRKDSRLPEAGINIDTGMGLVVEEENFRSPRYGHRIIDLRFGPADRRLPTAWAIVDLTSEEVIKIGVYPKEELS